MFIMWAIAPALMAQAATPFDPEAKATDAVGTLGTVFGIVFGLAIAIVVGWKVVQYLRRTA